MVLTKLLTHYRERIIEEWIERLSTEVSERYSQRPLEEFQETVTRAYEASFAVLVHNDYSKIHEHIEWITSLRLQDGFSLSEVQNAYELYRTVLRPILLVELRGNQLDNVLKRLDHCLFYTITRFSNYFQSVHEKSIREYAQNLQVEVEERTRQLSESEAKHRVLVEEINDGYFVNQSGVIVFANRAFCEMHGYTVDEVVGRPFTDFVAPESLLEVKELYETRVSGGEAEILYTYLRRRKDDVSLATENKVKLINYERQKAVAGICRDITERLEMERRVRESERFAYIGQLTTSLAHEIRNPLSAIKMNSQILAKNLRLNGNDRKRGEIISKEISRLERILTEMLDFAKPVRLDPRPSSINDILDSCLEILDEKLREGGIMVNKHCSARIPGFPVDPDKIEQAILNVLLNSVEALSPGSEIRVVTKPTRKYGKGVVIEIHDNGPGIRPEDYPYVFDPFFSSKKKGTGLGLSNVKKIVEAHGGVVTLLPPRNRGTHVQISLPCREGHEA